MVRRTLNLQNGRDRQKLYFEFNTEAHMEEFNRLHAEVIKAELAMKKDGTSTAAEQYGTALMAFYRLIFGEANARALEAWYGDNVLGMISEINPFIRSVVLPDVERCSATRAAHMRREFLRKQKRAAKS